MTDTQENAAFDRLLGEISSRLLTAGSGSIDAAIRKSVVAIGEHYRVDRVDLRRFNEDLSAMSLLHGWTSSDDISVASNIPNHEIPWVSSMLLRGQVVRFSGPGDMPPSASPGRLMIEKDGLAAIMAVPISVEGQPFGPLSLASKHEREWSDETVSEIKTLGELFAISHVRARKLNTLWTREAHLRAVIENQSDLIVRWLPDGTRTWVNDAYCKFYQTQRRELIGTSAAPTIVPEDLEGVLASVATITPENPTQTEEHRVIKPSGEIVWLYWTDKGIFDGDGNLIEYQSIGNEVTDRKKAELALRQSETRYRDLVENISDWIWELNLELEVIYSNANVESVLGYTSQEVIGASPQQSLHPDDLLISLAMIEEQISDPVGWEQVLLRFRHKDGSYRTLQSNAQPTFDADGHLAGFRGVNRDVTEAVKAHEEIVHRSEFQHELARLSTGLLTAPLEDTQQLADNQYQRIGYRYGLYSAGIWTLTDDDKGMITRRAGWRDEQQLATRRVDRHDRDAVPWFSSRILSNKIVRIDCLEDMPDEAAVDRELFRAIGLTSILGFPALASTELRGYNVFATVEQRHWDDETVQELELIANTMTAACARLWAAEENVHSQQDLMRSQEIAGLCSYSTTYDPPVEQLSLDGKVTRSSQYFKLHGVDELDETTEKAFTRIHPEDAKRVLDAYREGFTSKPYVKQTYRMIRPDNTMAHIEARIEFDRDEQGRVQRVFGTDHDVTEQVRAREELETALAEIKKLRDQLQQENLYLRDEVRAAHGFDRIIGSGPKLKRALILAEKVAPTGVSVLVLGETGTGKELIAQAVHDLSDRKDSAMISVNCAALSRDLIESELFGHEKGAFTGSLDRRKGRFELANGGTLFLDEVGELPGDLQAKLLRVLQSGEYERLGGTETLHSDVRIIAATNKDLRRAVDDGEFRADLYYRISTFPIELPPLRERTEDIPALVEFLVNKHAKRMNKDIRSISARTLVHLSQQTWPGNVRELEGVLQRALISTSGPVLDYVEEIRGLPLPVTDEVQVSAASPPTTDLHEAQRQHIRSVLEKSRWVIDGKTGAASMMGVAASTLRSKMKRLGIERPG